MRIKWKYSYYPHGGWVNNDGESVSLPENFYAEHEDTKLLVTTTSVSTAPGHGEPAMTGSEPKFIDAASLETVKLSTGVIIEIDEDILK